MPIDDFAFFPSEPSSPLLLVDLLLFAPYRIRMHSYATYFVYPTFPTVGTWNKSGAGPVAVSPSGVHYESLMYEAHSRTSHSSTSSPQSSFVPPHSHPSFSSPPTIYLGDVGAEPSIAGSSILSPIHSPAAPQTPKKRTSTSTTAEKRATLREKNRLSKRAQRERQVQKLAMLEEKVVEQVREIKELRQKLRKSEEVVSMLMREVRAGKWELSTSDSA